MPLIDLVDDTFVAAEPALVARFVHDPARWRQWWPTLELTTTRDRRAKGRQWVARGTAPRAPRSRRPVALVGTVEIWMEPVGDGVVVHHFLRLDPSGRDAAGLSRRWVDRQRAAFATVWKRQVHALKDELEAGREPGTPAVGVGRQGQAGGGRCAR